MFGYDSAGTVGLPVEMLVPERFRAMLPSRIANFANEVVDRRPRDSRMSLTGLRSDGTEFPIQVSISKSELREQTEFTAIVRDMTDVERARKEQEALLASKDRLIASVSHEFRTPLTAVVGFARLLQADKSDQPNPERSEMIQTIINQGNDLTNMVEDLLVVAKAETGSLVFVAVTVDIRAQSVQVIEALGERQTGNITFSGEPVHGIGDPARVRQVVRNLISNALRYGGGEAEVTFDKYQNTARVQVSDSGPGVPPEDRERIFLPYQRAHTDLGITESMGLGLTISRDLARGMGGDVTYRRVDNKTIFELRLPAAD